MSKGRVLFIHNFYRRPGGEEAVLRGEMELLSAAGWEVELFSVDSGEISGQALPKKLARLAQTPYAFGEARRLKRLLAQRRFDVAHMHNLNPFLGSAVARALPKGLPRLKTLHNFRAFCINGMFLRDGKACEDCAPSRWMPGLMHRCHEGSLASSLAMTGVRVANLATDAYASMGLLLCPSQFVLAKHQEHGFPAARLWHLPNFVPDTDERSSCEGCGVFAGRLSKEKGVDVLLDALLMAKDLPVTVLGAGPMEEQVRSVAERLPGLKATGWADREGMRRALLTAGYMVLPSLFYENQPMAVLEAMAMGLPIVSSRSGGLAELVQDGLNGFLVDPIDPMALAQAMHKMQALSVAERRRMGQASRGIYEAQFTPRRHLEGLLKAYAQAAEIEAAV